MVMTRTIFSTILALTLLLIFAACSESESLPQEAETVQSAVTIGAQNLMDHYLEELQGKNVGLVMNPTARIGNTHVLDSLLALNVNITALYAPEHGFRGEAGAGEKIEDGVDQESGLPIYSLYGDTRKPTQEMLEGTDLLIFDMQDVGARFYTYIATLGLVIEAAAEAGIPVWVLDRPNPAGGDYVSGWILEEEFESFVGAYPIPIAHGLTMGEIAMMMVGENWIDFDLKPEIRVIEMTGWEREMKWPDTGLNWVPPSPNLPTFEHAYFYLGNVFYEGTTLSEGRGTDNPFLTMGDPATNLGDEQLASLRGLSNDISVVPLEFTPQSIPGAALNPKHEGVLCSGIIVRAENYDFDPVRTGLQIFATMLNNTEDYEIKSFLYRLAGTRKIDQVINGELSVAEIDFELDNYLAQRESYLLY
jgi:uncharacterized protein YbbC (DUF1343 family)